MDLTTYMSNHGMISAPRSQEGVSIVENPLNNLASRVEQALAQQENKSSAVDPRQVAQAVSEISQQPVAGLNHSIVV